MSLLPPHGPDQIRLFHQVYHTVDSTDIVLFQAVVPVAVVSERAIAVKLSKKMRRQSSLLRQSNAMTDSGETWKGTVRVDVEGYFAELKSPYCVQAALRLVFRLWLHKKIWNRCFVFFIITFSNLYKLFKFIWSFLIILKLNKEYNVFLMRITRTYKKMRHT